MLDCLEHEFVNAWILQEDLEALIRDEEADADLRAMARTVFANLGKHSLVPVGIHVMSADGELFSKGSVNRDRLMGRRGTAKYLKILREGAAAHRASMR